jgi:hypothetical protein
VKRHPHGRALWVPVVGNLRAADAPAGSKGARQKPDCSFGAKATLPVRRRHQDTISSFRTSSNVAIRATYLK